MDNETIIKPEYKEEVVRIFRKIVASGVINKDAAITKILRDYPHYFHQPTPDDIVKISRSELNGEIRQRARAGVQSNKLSIDFFRSPADKQKPV
jgi:hypothetical protein